MIQSDSQPTSKLRHQGSPSIFHLYLHYCRLVLNIYVFECDYFDDRYTSMSQSEADPFYSSGTYCCCIIRHYIAAVRSYEPCGSFMIDYEAYSERMGIQMNHILISMNTTIATSVVASDGGGNAASGTTVTNNAPSNTIGSTNAALAVPQGGGGDEVCTDVIIDRCRHLLDWC